MRAACKVQAAQFAANIPPIIRDILAAYTSLNVIAGQLNARKVATANGGQCQRPVVIADDEARAIVCTAVGVNTRRRGVISAPRKTQLQAPPHVLRGATRASKPKRARDEPVPQAFPRLER